MLIQKQTCVGALIVCSSLVLLGFGFFQNQPTEPLKLQKRRLKVVYQSKSIPLNEWLAQFTLCFTPFATHLLTGVPSFVRTPGAKPPSLWHQIAFFHPMTIIWRYAMIADRRIRARNWSPADLAATNAAFWTGAYWDGSESIMFESREWVTRAPHHNRVPWISVSIVGTVIVTIQGVQAIYQLSEILWKHVTPIQGLAGMFVPLALGSLFRIPCALWLTSDFGYGDGDGTTRLNNGASWPLSRPDTGRTGESTVTLGVGGTLDMDDRLAIQGTSMRPQRYWKAVVFRLFYLLFILAIILTFGIGHVLAQPDIPDVASVIILHFLYISLCLILFLLSIYYFIRGQGDTTLIPCINSTWYTIFTLLWYAWAVACIVINSLEMRRTYCGVYTTFPIWAGLDQQLCALFQ
jgi:hypothetical protein